MTDLDKPLFEAIRSRDWITVLELVENGINVNIRDKYNHTPLTKAVSNSDFKIVEILLSEGNADVNLPGFNGETPLMVSVLSHNYYKAFDIIPLLLKHGANVNTQNDNGDTALMWAAQACRIEETTLLINSGADIGIVNKWGDTASQIVEEQIQIESGCSKNRVHQLVEVVELLTQH